MFAICDKHGSLFDLELGPANTDDRAGTLPILPRLAALGFQGDLLGDSGFTGAPFATAALAHDIHVWSRPAEHGTGVPAQRDQMGGGTPLRSVEPLPAADIVFDRAPDLFVVHIWIGIISIISRRLFARVQASKGFNRVQLLNRN